MPHWEECLTWKTLKIVMGRGGGESPETKYPHYCYIINFIYKTFLSFDAKCMNKAMLLFPCFKWAFFDIINFGGTIMLLKYYCEAQQESLEPMLIMLENMEVLNIKTIQLALPLNIVPQLKVGNNKRYLNLPCWFRFEFISTQHKINQE